MIPISIFDSCVVTEIFAISCKKSKGPKLLAESNLLKVRDAYRILSDFRYNRKHKEKYKYQICLKSIVEDPILVNDRGHTIEERFISFIKNGNFEHIIYLDSSLNIEKIFTSLGGYTLTWNQFVFDVMKVLPNIPFIANCFENGMYFEDVLVHPPKIVEFYNNSNFKDFDDFSLYYTIHPSGYPEININNPNMIVIKE